MTRFSTPFPRDGAAGATGATGATGPAGPNSVSATTSTTLTGILRGDGSLVSTVTVGSGLSFSAGTLSVATGTFLALSGGTLTGPLMLSTSTTGAAAYALYGSGNTLRYRDSTNTERMLLNATDNLANLSNVATARTNLGLGSADSPTFLANTLTGQSLTGSQANSILALASTWNTTGTPSAIDVNVTDTASNTNSRLLDLRTGGTSRFGVRKDGRIFGPNANVYLDLFVGGNVQLVSFSNSLQLSDNGISILGASSTAITFGTGSAPLLVRDGNFTISQRTGTNGQIARWYKTFTSATNGEWVEVDAANNASNFDIAVCSGSAGGTLRGLRFGAKSAGGAFSSWLSFDTSGNAALTGFMSAARFATSGGNGLLLATDGSFAAGTRIQNLGTDGKTRIANFGATGGGYLNATVADTFIFNNLADSAGAELRFGNIIITPSASRTLAANGQFTVEMTSNTAGNLVYRGSDGTTRRMALTFS